MSSVIDWLTARNLIGGLLFGAALASFPLGAGNSYATECGATYTVRGGDSLGRIANRCGVSIDGIVKANADMRDPSKLRVGQRLIMPNSSDAKPGHDDKVEMTGRILNGRRCAQLQTPDGKVYGLVSPKIPFTSGKVVIVTGSMHAYNGCRPELTMLVSAITEAGS